jgi:hypothetical protein
MDVTGNVAGDPFIFGDGSAKIMGSTVDATSGLASLTYTLQARTATDWSNPIPIKTDTPLTANPTWNIVLGAGGLGLADGSYRIKVIAKDNAKKAGGASNPGGIPNPNETVNGTGLDEWIYFILDTVSPALTLASTEQYYNRDIPLEGTVSDTNGIDRIEVSFTSTPASKVTLKGDKLIGGAWSTTLPIAGAYTLEQGSQTINITAYDKAGHTTTLQREIILDTTAPSGVAVKQPNIAGKRVIGELTVSGVASDNNSVSKLFYQIGKPDITPTSVIEAGKAYTIENPGATESIDEWKSYGATAVAKGVSFIAAKSGTINGGTALAWKDTLLDSGGAEETKPTGIQWSGGVWAWEV